VTSDTDAKAAGPLAVAKPSKLHRNLAPARLVMEAIGRSEGRLSSGGAFVAETGKFTGRSPKDKFIVDHPSVHDEIDWGPANAPISPDKFDGLLDRAIGHMRGKELFVQDLWAGADPAFRISVQVITEQAWHNLFARNMFIRPPHSELSTFVPDWTVLQLPSFKTDPARDGTNSDTLIALDIERRLVLIGGTAYAGEIKKSIFTVLNYLLPARNVLPMHCSANADDNGRAALFFGLSGTGKTTLSADPNRTLIGDDEHGWGHRGIFNFEGGCYAKVIRLDAEAEPEIYAASIRFGAILENVVLDEESHEPDFEDGHLTENTRSSYPIHFIGNASHVGTAGHPTNIVMLTADAFGVLPPISRLTPAQAMYHFLSGYTARLAGTERGVNEPQATFSTCFGAPFMPRHPTVYAKLLGDLMRKHGVHCWLLNTGWTGGAFGTGRRMPIKATRRLLHAALDGHLSDVPTSLDPIFGLHIPKTCPDVDESLLRPRSTWEDKAEYDAVAREVAARFERNFEKFHGHVGRDVEAAAIRAAA
jgi:phosphoenolpyruvate carboxykinase (ATP)